MCFVYVLQWNTEVVMIMMEVTVVAVAVVQRLPLLLLHSLICAGLLLFAWLPFRSKWVKRVSRLPLHTVAAATATVPTPPEAVGNDNDSIVIVTITAVTATATANIQIQQQYCAKLYLSSNSIAHIKNNCVKFTGEGPTLRHFLWQILSFIFFSPFWEKFSSAWLLLIIFILHA